MSHVMTVRGPVDPAALGPTTMHEHVFWDYWEAWWSPDTFEQKELTEEPMSIFTSGLARWNALGMKDNFRMGPEEYDAQARELAEMVAAGGGCLVDLSCDGIRPQPALLRQISEHLGLHIVAGCGLYVHTTHDAWVEQATVEELEEFILAQVRNGLAGTGVRPGIIGEIGSSNPVQPCEERVIRAAGRVGAATGLAVNVHTTAPGRFGPRIVQALVEEGMSADRIVLSHLDEVLDVEYHLEILRAGAIVEFDTFGFEGYFARLWKTPSDQEKMEALVDLVERGYVRQLVVGHDVGLKVQTRRFGGLGYDHIFRRVAPALEAHYGVATADMHTILVDTPRRLLTVGDAGGQDPAATAAMS